MILLPKLIDKDLWHLFIRCSEGTKRCHGCKWNNQRTDGMCCSLVDEINKKREEKQ